MKKKKQRRLRLRRETLRRLEDPPREEVWGGCGTTSPLTLPRLTVERCDTTPGGTGPKQQ